MEISLPVSYTEYKDVDIGHTTILFYLRKTLINGYEIQDNKLVEYGKISRKDYGWIPVRTATPEELEIDQALNILDKYLSD